MKPTKRQEDSVNVGQAEGLIKIFPTPGDSLSILAEDQKLGPLLVELRVGSCCVPNDSVFWVPHLGLKMQMCNGQVTCGRDADPTEL